MCTGRCDRYFYQTATILKCIFSRSEPRTYFKRASLSFHPKLHLEDQKSHLKFKLEKIIVDKKLSEIIISINDKIFDS